MKHQGRRTHGEDRLRLMQLILCGILALIGMYCGGRWLEMRSAKPETRGTYIPPSDGVSVIEVAGEAYTRRERIRTILLIGVDRSSDAMVTSGYRNGGQADFLQLVVIDEAEKTMTRVQIDRDTVTSIVILGVLSDPTGVRRVQICLAHGFGDGREQSCELTAQAVSGLLMDVPVDEYIAMSLDGIPFLNDAVGGITVTLEDDFSALDASMTKGATLTLTGEQAELFVRSRRSIGVGTNEARMRRQKQYLAQMTAALDSRIRADRSFMEQLYDALLPYTVTGISKGLLINTVWNARDYQRSFVELEGTYAVGADGFVEFHADEQKLQELVLRLFYQPVH